MRRIGVEQPSSVELASLTLPLVVAALLTGCGLEWPRNAEVVEVPRPKLEEGLFPVAAPRVTEASAPARFAEELPATVATFRAEERTLPRAFLEHRLCSGDPEVVARLERAAAAAAPSTNGDELRATYGSLLAWCGRSELCDWTRAAVERGGALAEVAWVGLAQCPSADNDRIFESDRAPARELVTYWSNREWQSDFAPRHVPALVPALRRAVELGDAFLLRRAALLLGKHGNPHGVAALVALHGELPAGDARDQVAAGLAEANTPEARAIFEELCRRPGRRETMCDADRGLVQVQGVPGLAATPEPEAPPASDPSLKSKLEKLGLLWRGPLAVDAGFELEEGDSAPRDAQGWLVTAGPVHCFDVETGDFPNGHDALLFELAELAGPPLADALFAEIAPPLDLGEGRWLVAGGEVDRLPDGLAAGDPYRLTGYLDGRAWEVDAQDFGDWYDLDQVIGLLNAMAIDRGAATRLVVLPTEDQTACVLAAPRPAILAGVSSGLLDLGDADAARAAGQAFEAVVFEQLEKGELDLGVGQ